MEQTTSLGFQSFVGFRNAKYLRVDSEPGEARLRRAEADIRPYMRATYGGSERITKIKPRLPIIDYAGSLVKLSGMDVSMYDTNYKKIIKKCE